ncbi:MAG: nitroreductase family protein [Candidatus Hodarchaeales archaeon]|jgi:nitroreductase
MDHSPALTNAIELIKQRNSIRTFDLSLSLDKQIVLVNQFIAKLPESPFAGFSHFEVYEFLDLKKYQKLRLGTYGFVKRAEKFIVGIITKPSRFDLEDIGFLFEHLVLFVTGLGLGTVWLGGTFSRKAFSSRLNLNKGERIPVISPIGWVAQKQTLRSKAIKSIAGSKNRKPWSQLFFESNFDTPLGIDEAGKFKTPLEMTRLSPSASNFQPWRILKIPNENIFHFYIYRKSPRSHTLLNWPDFSRIDLGIAVSHFDLTVKELNLDGKWLFEIPDVPQADNLEYLISWISE